MEIEILYIEGCPHREETVQLVDETVERLGLDAEIVETEVADEEQARRLGFLGSPSVRLDGEDIEPGAMADATVGLGCRVYETPDGLSGTPPVEMLEAALSQ